MEFKIEKGVSIPPVIRKSVGAPSKYPFKEMAVGDSFSVPLSERRRVVSAASSHKRRHGAAFTVRMLEDEVRVWRVE